MEYVLVSYPTERDVHIDGQAAGKTNANLMVEKGHHDFDLGAPDNYTPASVRKAVENTTALTPLRIEDFRPKGGGA